MVIAHPMNHPDDVSSDTSMNNQVENVINSNSLESVPSLVSDVSLRTTISF